MRQPNQIVAYSGSIKVRRMDVQDVLFNICIKLDDEALYKLVLSLSLWREVNELLKSNVFWYERTMHLAGRKLDNRSSANWKKIYHSLKLRQKYEAEGEDHTTGPRALSQIYGLDDLDTLLVLEKIYGLPDQKRLEYLLSVAAIRSPEVLNYLIKPGDLEYVDGILEALDVSSELKQTQMIEPLLDLLPERSGTAAYGRAPRSILTTAAGRGESATVKIIMNRSAEIRADIPFLENVLVSAASSRADRATVQLLLPYVTSQRVRSRAMNAAARNDNEEVLQVMMEVLKPDLAEKKELYLLTHPGSEGTMLLLLKDDSRVQKAKGLERESWRDLLLDSIKNNHKRLVAYLLDNHVSAATEGNIAMHIAARTGPEMFKIVLSYPRIDPVPDLVDTIKSSRNATRNDIRFFENVKKNPIFTTRGRLASEIEAREEIADILLRDKRVDIESLDTRTLRIAAWSISNLISNRVKAFSPGLSELSYIVETGEDIYAIVLRFLIFKRPSNVELLDWMIGKKDRQLATAAQLVLSNKSPGDDKLIPIVALLSFILYPTLKVEEIVTELEERGVDEEVIALSSSLVNIHSG